MYYEFRKFVYHVWLGTNKNGPKTYFSEASDLDAANVTKSSLAIAAPANPIKPISTYTSVMLFLLG